MSAQKSFFYRCEYGAIAVLVLACFFTPFSTSLMGAAGVICTVLWLFSGKARNLGKIITGSLPPLLASVLFLMLIVGVVYSVASTEESLDVLKKYRELLYFLVVLSLLKGRTDVSKYAENGFVAGCIVLLTLSTLMYAGVLPNAKYGHSTVYHITHSFFMALLAFWCLQNVVQRNRFRFLWGGVFVATSINLFYMVPGRTGMMVFIALMVLTILQRTKIRYIIPVTLLATSLVAVTYISSDNFSSRIQEAITEVRTYTPNVSRTSLGMRFDWWKNSVDLIGEKPFTGFGTGSFATAQQELIQSTGTQPSDNPHNEYLMLGVQLGLGGPLLFIGLLGSLLWSGIKIEKPRGYMLQGVVVAMASGCLMNSFLFDSHQGHFFAFLSAVLLAPSLKTTEAHPAPDGMQQQELSGS